MSTRICRAVSARIASNEGELGSGCCGAMRARSGSASHADCGVSRACRCRPVPPCLSPRGDACRHRRRARPRAEGTPGRLGSNRSSAPASYRFPRFRAEYARGPTCAAICFPPSRARSASALADRALSRGRAVFPRTGRPARRLLYVKSSRQGATGAGRQGWAAGVGFGTAVPGAGGEFGGQQQRQRRGGGAVAVLEAPRGRCLEAEAAGAALNGARGRAGGPPSAPCSFRRLTDRSTHYTVPGERSIRRKSVSVKWRSSEAPWPSEFSQHPPSRARPS